MKRVQWWVLPLAMVAVSVSLAPALAQQPTPGPTRAPAPVVLKTVAAWPTAWPFDDMYAEWIKRVNERARGQLRIELIGGPEVYPAFEQLDPLKRGVIDAVVTTMAYVAGAIPEVGATWFGFGAHPEQLRASGLVDLLDRVTREKVGVTFLGMPLYQRFNLYLNRPLERADLRGFKIRSLPVYDPVVKGLGGSSVSLPATEVYTALQTGVADGLGWPAAFVVEPGFAKLLKYKVMPPWWIGVDLALMNARSFDRLPADLKKLLVETMREIEREVPGYFLDLEKKQDEKLAQAGVKIIELPAMEVEKVKRIHWEAGSKAFLLGPSPTYGRQLTDLMGRFAPR